MSCMEPSRPLPPRRPDSWAAAGVAEACRAAAEDTSPLDPWDASSIGSGRHWLQGLHPSTAAALKEDLAHLDASRGKESAGGADACGAGKSTGGGGGVVRRPRLLPPLFPGTQPALFFPAPGPAGSGTRGGPDGPEATDPVRNSCSEGGGGGGRVGGTDGVSASISGDGSGSDGGSGASGAHDNLGQLALASRSSATQAPPTSPSSR